MNTNPSPLSLKVIWAVLAVLFLASLGWLSYGNYAAGSEPWQMVASTVILSIPLGLLYFSIGLLATAREEKRSQGRLGERLAKTIYRVPRFGGILICLFVGLFALDVFTAGPSFWQMLGAFLIHALPALGIAVLLALAWRRPLIGCLAFAAAAFYFMRFMLGSPLQGIGIGLIFSGPLAAIALLFWADWRWVSRAAPAGPPSHSASFPTGPTPG